MTTPRHPASPSAPRPRLARLALHAAVVALAAAGWAGASEISLDDGADLPAWHVPDWVIAGIAAIETRSTYRDGNLVAYRDRRDGNDGEVGPWQLAPTALRDLNAGHLLSRIRQEPLLAESMARAWLLRCYRLTGDWFAAVAIYHTGPRGNPARGRNYAERVFAVGNQP